MLDERDIQIIAQLMRQQFEQQAQRLDLKLEQKLEQKLAKLKVELKAELKTELKAELVPEVMHNVRVLMESYFDPKFDALSEEVRMIHEIIIPPQRMEEAETQINVLEGVVRLHSREIEALKAAR